jgi:hypothetical protein
MRQCREFASALGVQRPSMPVARSRRSTSSGPITRALRPFHDASVPTLPRSPRCTQLND